MDTPQVEQAEVCFVACHPAAGSHFADFYFELMKQGRVRCRVLATEKAADELAKRNVPTYDFYYGKKSKTLKYLSDEEQDELAAAVALLCRKARWVITDLGQEFATKVQTKIAERYPNIVRIAYYDNPESYVPGGYSATAAKTMQKAHAILFANAKLAASPIYCEPSVEIDLQGKQKIGLGYANMQDVEAIRDKRKPESRLPLRTSLLSSKATTLAVYFGGANEVYYGQAFPRFLQILDQAAKTQDLSNLSILVQQHPRSLSEGNRDGLLLYEWKKVASPHAPQVNISQLSFNDALAAADIALYYQTSAAAKFMLVGVPTAQIGHEPFLDVLVRNGFCPAVTDEKQLIQLLKHPLPPSEEVRAKLVAESGISPAWPEHLASALAQTQNNY